MVNWLEEVTKRQDELLEDLVRLLKVPSVREDDLATVEAPVGPGPKAALEEFLKMDLTVLFLTDLNLNRSNNHF